MTSNRLLEAALSAGQPVPSRPAFWLAGTDEIYLVAGGAVDVFAQRRGDDGRASGARHHVYRTGAGQIVMGVEPKTVQRGWGFLLVPLPDAKLVRLSPGELDRLARDLDAVDEVVALAEGWILSSIRGLAQGLPPRQAKHVGADPVTAQDGDVLAPAHRVGWIETIGNALWLGRYDCVLNADNGIVPVPGTLWLSAPSDVTVRAVSAAEVLQGGGFWRALAQHQVFVLKQTLANLDEALDRESARLTDKANRSMIITREALARLMSLGGPKAAAATQRQQDTLLRACEVIGRCMSIDFRLPGAADQAALERDPVGTMAHTAKVRSRPVALKGEWWLADNGPLLAAWNEGKGWVALVPHGDRRYHLHDPATDAVTLVDEEMAARIAPFATMFYRGFPDVKMTPVGLLRWAAQGHGRDIATVVAMGVLGGLLGMLTPIATGMLVDTHIPAADGNAVLQMVFALLAAAIASTMFEVTRSIAMLRLEGKMDGSVQAAVWDRVLKLPVPFFRQYAAGDLALRINGVNTIRKALSGHTLSTLLTSFFSMFNLALLFYYSAKLAMIALGIVAVAVLVTIGIGYLKLRYERRLSELNGRLSSRVFQYLSGITKLRVSSAEGRAFANWSEAFVEFRDTRFRAEHLENVLKTFFAGYGVFSTMALFATIGMLMAGKPDGTMPPGQSAMSTGQFIAFSAAFGTFFGAMVGMAQTLLDLLNLVPVYERAKPILESLPEVDVARSHPGELEGSIEVVKLGFRYGDGPDILKDVTFSIRPGGYVALVGPSGSGKSTLFRLMLGFEQPTTGSVYFDHQDISSLDVNALRRQLGVVLQASQLMAGDIFTNIVGTSQLGIDDAWEAARMVGLDADIKAMPMGMHTVIGEGASTLSGGQRQRILIARSIVNRPRILFFDEATSALDNRTQAIVASSLDALKATRIVIAHRLSTVVNADRILVLVDGRIVQDGNFRDLMAVEGPFRELAQRQLA